MQAAPARYVSVSELYSTDEVELLLDEIRELEPTSCRGEDLQDFEIAGSGCEGVLAGGGGGAEGGRSPGSLTERSWDSHAQYRRDARGGRSGVALYWRPRRLLAPRGACALAAVACCGAACACVWAGVGLRLGALPLAGRVQLLQAAALSAALLHGALLAAALGGLEAAVGPAPAPRLAAGARLLAAAAAAALAAGAAATLAALRHPAYAHAPPHLARLLYSAAGLGLGGACASGALAGVGGFGGCCRRGPSEGGAGAALTGAGAGAGVGVGAVRRAGAGGAYRAVPAAPLPSTSTDHPL